MVLTVGSPSNPEVCSPSGESMGVTAMIPDATIGQLAADIWEVKRNREAAKAAVAEATTIREKKAAEFAKSHRRIRREEVK